MNDTGLQSYFRTCIFYKHLDKKCIYNMEFYVLSTQQTFNYPESQHGYPLIRIHQKETMGKNFEMRRRSSFWGWLPRRHTILCCQLYQSTYNTIINECGRVHGRIVPSLLTTGSVQTILSRWSTFLLDVKFGLDGNSNKLATPSVTSWSTARVS